MRDCVDLLKDARVLRSVEQESYHREVVEAFLLARFGRLKWLQRRQYVTIG